jgi:IMP dehydrogenase
MDIPLGLTFDDVLLRPGRVRHPALDGRPRTRLTRGIALNIPVLSAAMDTVTEADMAIVMAQLGGIGVLHRNLTIEEQCARCARSSGSKAAWWSTRSPSPRCHAGRGAGADAANRISGIPVVEVRASWSASSPTATCALPTIRCSRCAS